MPTTLPKLHPNYQKILESILFLIETAEARGEYLTEFEIDKAIFAADLSHLRSYGRPITFDNYVAMKNGPVPSTVRDLLQNKLDIDLYYRETWPLWDRVPSPKDGPRAFKYVNPKRHANKQLLSETDVAALESAVGSVKALQYQGATDWTHLHPAYIEAWSRRGTGNASDIDYRQLFEGSDDDDIEELVYSSHNM